MLIKEGENKMPIYEYECDSCKEIQEVCQSISDEPKTTCPKCSGSLRKLISMSSFQLKGSGWYSDGYSGASKGAAKCCEGSSVCSSSPAEKKSAAEKSCPKADGPSCACA
jgi:putative FmdB family regulatory protein